MGDQRGPDSPGPSPEPSGQGDELEKVPLGDMPDHEPGARTYPGGTTRLTLGSILVLSEGGQARGLGRYVQYVAVIENKKNGHFLLEPTQESDLHRLPLTMMEGHHQAAVSLRKLLKRKGIKIPRGHSMYIPCSRAELPEGPALELRLPERRIEPIQSHSTAPTRTTPATPATPPAPSGPAAPTGPAAQGSAGGPANPPTPPSTPLDDAAAGEMK